MEIAGSLTGKARTQIEKLLCDFSEEKFEVIIIKQSDITTLKSQLTNKIESSKDWKLIKKHFPSSKISSILLKI